MPLTVAQLVALPELDLGVRTDGIALDREVRWVAVSEHADPRPWIAEGDLLLTTGLTLDVSPSGAKAYVDRLAGVGVAGLGLGTGVGLSHETVPETLVAAAAGAGLPLFEVPEPVPFVAISKAVSRLLAAQEYAEATAAFDSQRRLLRTVLDDARGDAADDAILRVVARHVGGFALLLSADGAVRGAWPEAAARRAPEFAAEVDRLRPRGMRGSSSLATADEHVSLLPVGLHGAADAFLVVGSPRVLRPADQGVLTLAVSLLARPAVTPGREDAWRAVLVRHASVAGIPADALPSIGLDRLTAARAVGVVIRADSVDAAVREQLDAGRAEVVVALTGPGRWEGFASVDSEGGLPAVLDQLAALPGVRSVGVSAPLDLREPANVIQALDQAGRAAQARGLRRNAPGSSTGLLDLLDAASATQWARAYLGALIDSDEGVDLMDTVHAWLEQHGQVDAAAQHLGIHRHTVRHRLRRAETVLDRPLDDPQVRADLWFALLTLRRHGG